MTTAFKQLAATGGTVLALVSALAATTLIWMIFTNPDEAVLAMSDGSVSDVLSVTFERVASLLVELLRWL